MLTAVEVCKSYAGVKAVDDVTFTLDSGTVLALVGANGAGKSTLIKCLLGLVKFGGKVTFEGIDVSRHGDAARKMIGYLPQNPSFHEDLSVAETAMFYCELKSLETNAGIRGAREIGLGAHLDKKVGELSGGMRQRLGLAVALLGEPKLLVFDEPVAGLDMSARLELRKLVVEQRTKNRAVLLSTHWLEDLPYIADQVLMLDHGRCAYFGSTKEAKLDSTSSLFVRVLDPNSVIDVVAQVVAESKISRSSDWVVIACDANERVMILEDLAIAGLTILDFRVEDVLTARPTFDLRDENSSA